MPAKDGAEQRHKKTAIKAVAAAEAQIFSFNMPRTLSLASLHIRPPTNCPPAAPVTDTAP